jgi:hypothetical protein
MPAASSSKRLLAGYAMFVTGRNNGRRETKVFGNGIRVVWYAAESRCGRPVRCGCAQVGDGSSESMRDGCGKRHLSDDLSFGSIVSRGAKELWRWGGRMPTKVCGLFELGILESAVIDKVRGAGPGGPARTGGSAPLSYYLVRVTFCRVRGRSGFNPLIAAR